MATKTNEPFSFEGLEPDPSKLVEPIMVKASDGVDLAIRDYKPVGTKKATAMLLFYHGGGAHSGAGYNILARGLAEEFNMIVYTPDIRGHGASGGPKGDAPTVESIFEDIDTALSKCIQDKDDSLPLFLGGHSSGGGVLVNYLNWPDRKYASQLDGVVMVSPQLGHLAGVTKTKKGADEPQRPDFAKVNIPVFILNGIFGVMGHNPAVQFQYPQEILDADPGMVSFNTVNMANAITPTAPREQFENIDLPLALWVGQEDELFDANKVAAYAEMAKNGTGIVLKEETHLGILLNIHKVIGPWIKKQVGA